ncbi:MAG: PQQ-binding-like beta-propeller repeat protein [Flavobacteriaceae bacterium]
MRRLAAVLFIAAISGGLAGCDAVTGAASKLNVFSKEERMPGERRPAFETNAADEADTNASSTPVSIPPATAAYDWSQPGGTPSNAPGNRTLGGQRFSTSIGASSGSGSIRDFSFGGDSGRKLVASPIVYNGAIFTIDGFANVRAMGGGGGTSWTAALKPDGERGAGGYGGGIAADSGRIVAATGYGKVHGLDAATGAVLWTQDLESPARSAPTAVGGKVYFVSADNVVHCLAIEDGAEQWTYRGIPSTAGLLSTSSPAVSGDRVVVPYSSGEIIAFSAKDGSPLWGDQLAGASRFSAVSGLRDVAGSPVIDNGVVYAVGVGGRMIAVAAKDGERLWARNIASAQTPVVAGNSIFVVSLSGEVEALDRSNGGRRWKTDLPGGANVSWAGPVLAGSRLWLASSDGRIVTVDPVSGTVSSDQKTAGPVYIPPIAAAGSVIVLDDTGRLSAYN